MYSMVKDSLKKVPLIVRIWHYLKGSPSPSQRLSSWLKNKKILVQNKLQGGLSIPPEPLIFLVAGTDNVQWFLSSGAMAAQSLRDIFTKNKIKIENLEKFLDFGCGVGRVTRHWRDLKKPTIHGTDYNPSLIEWCRKELGFAHFQVNDLAGKLDYDNNQFDMIYALSVFTHMTEPNQLFWMDELTRVLMPGGYLFITTHGDFYQSQTSPGDLEKYLQGELVVYGGDQEGSNMCAAFLPVAYVHEKMAKNLIVLDYVPEGALGNPRQDVYLLRKPLTA